MKRIAIICQRYGMEVNGGAEYHARNLAEKLTQNYEVYVLTTTALEYQEWKNYFEPGDTQLNGVFIKRFKTLPKNKKYAAKRYNNLVRKHHRKVSKILTALVRGTKKALTLGLLTENKNWLKTIGPHSPDMIKYIKQNKETYDCFIFFTFLIYPTYWGLREVKRKSILIPLAHDEPLLYTRPYKNIFYQPKYILYNTLREQQLVEGVFPDLKAKSAVAGMGLNQLQLIEQDLIPSEYKFQLPYFIYIGRIDKNKGCDELIDYFSLFNKVYRHVNLVLVGQQFMSIPENDRIITVGFVSEGIKQYLLSKSLGLIIPSKYESLSLVTLEAMQMGKPVIGQSACKVVVDHIYNSGAGICYSEYHSFERALLYIMNLSDCEKEQIAKKGQAYILINYTWDKILAKVDDAIAFIVNQSISES